MSSKLLFCSFKITVCGRKEGTLTDLLAILQESLDQTLFSDIFTYEVQSCGVKASFLIIHIQVFYKMKQDIV